MIGMEFQIIPNENPDSVDAFLIWDFQDDMDMGGAYDLKEAVALRDKFQGIRDAARAERAEQERRRRDQRIAEWRSASHTRCYTP